MANGIASAFPTTVATPGEFNPNPDRSRDRDANPTVNLTPPAPRPTAEAAKDFNPNSINDKSHSHPNSSDLPWPDDFCPVPGIGDSKPDLSPQFLESRGLPPNGERPPVNGDLEVRPASRPSEVAKGGESLWDEYGGEWRYYPEDKYHNPHWDYNPHDAPNSRWQNIPIGSLPPRK